MTLVLLGGQGKRRKRSKPQPQPQPAAPACSMYPASQIQHQQYSPPAVHPAYNTSSSTHPPTIYPPAPQSQGQSRGSPPQYTVQPYLNTPYSQPGPSRSFGNLRDTLTAQAGKSVTQLKTKTSQCFDQSTNLISKKSTQALNQSAALCDLISSKLDTIITSIDGERFSGQEQELLVDDSAPSPGLEAPRDIRGNAVRPSTASKKGSNHFSKVWLYANSRLPPHLPPFKVYMPTWPLLCLAATYSERVYTPPSAGTPEVEAHVPSDWRSGTKAMVLKSVPIDDMNTIVFSIRGSATFMDWAVNYRSAPTSPLGFLDDEGNLCHSGFLDVARKMIKPVADRLNTLLQENPGRSNASLLITGHSAGGAVAQLLYAHMMSSTVESDLNYLTGFFKRVHCITFGAPPVSLLPLRRSSDKQHKKSLFYSLINEGDPVPRADKQVVRSLLKLYASPAPSSICNSTLTSFSKLNLSPSSNPSQTTLQSTSSKPSKMSRFSKTSSQNTVSTAASQPMWNIPATSLSTAGRLIVLREKPGRRRGSEEVEAITVDDELLRTVVYGDPMMHMMSRYKRRVEILATRAVTANGY